MTVRLRAAHVRRAAMKFAAPAVGGLEAKAREGAGSGQPTGGLAEPKLDSARMMNEATESTRGAQSGSNRH